jgi:MFS superfamily sulfate permease-like transporter
MVSACGAATAFSCFVLIIAQSAATSRSFAMKHSQRVDVNRDIVGLSGANLAAGLTGTFVVNGSPTKTQILDEQRGRTQLANMTMSLMVLVVVLFLTGIQRHAQAGACRDRVPDRYRSD